MIKVQTNVSRSAYSVSVLFLLIMATGICSADNINVDIVGQFSEDVSCIAAAGDYAYIDQGQDLVILDISDVTLLRRWVGQPFHQKYMIS